MPVELRAFFSKTSFRQRLFLIVFGRQVGGVAVFGLLAEVKSDAPPMIAGDEPADEMDPVWLKDKAGALLAERTGEEHEQR